MLKILGTLMVKGLLKTATLFTPTPTSGSLWNWGSNSYGELGDNTVIPKSSPIQTIAGGKNWKQVASCDYYAAGIKTDGTLWLWGDNGYGYLGDNTTIKRSSPVQTIAGGTNWKQVSGGSNIAAAVKTDGTLWTWGRNYHGNLGDDTVDPKSSPVQTVAGGTDWNQVSVGGIHTAAIKTDGTLWCWGRNFTGQLGDDTIIEKSSPVQTIAGGTNWKQVYCGNTHTAAIKTDGSLWCWGYNTNGELGDNTQYIRSSPVQTITYGNDWSKVSCGFQHTAAIKTDGSLWCWGGNSIGELGDNTTINRSSPVQTIAGGTNWKQVAAGHFKSAAIKNDGTLWVWGYNAYGYLGDSTTIDRSSPVQTVAYGSNWIDVSANILINAIYAETTTTPAPSGSLWAWGYAFNGLLGDNTNIDKSSPVQTITYGNDWKEISFRSGIKTNGTLWIWGNNYSGALGDNTIVNKSSPVQTITYSNDWQKLNSNSSHTAAIKSDGTLWLWGSNSYGELGDNTIISKSSPVQTVAGGSNWTQVVCGTYNTAAIKTDGTLWLWGRNYQGQLGDNTTIDKSSPIQTITYGTNWKQISIPEETGQVYCAAIKTDGTLWSWGWNSSGNLGDNTIISKSSPVQTIAGGINWKQVDLGLNFSAAVKTDGTLWLWGQGLYGELGDNTNGTNKSSPVQTITFGTNWKKVSCGSNIAAAVKTDGTLWTWGKNTYGQLGDDTTADKSSPVQTIAGSTNWIDVFVSGAYSVYGIRS